MSVQTLSELFLVATGHDLPDCLRHKVGDSWRSVSSQELADRVRRLSAALGSLGVRRGDRVALMAENGVHWPTVDFATLCIGAVTVPIYPTLTADQAAFVANDCGARVLFVDGKERLDAMLGERDSLPQVETFVLIGGDSADPSIKTLDSMIENSEPMPAAEFEAEARKAQPDDLATFIYTSGTTGKPKGVMLTHNNLASNAQAALARSELQKGWVALSFLPLSHVFERTVDYVYFLQGVSIAYAESVQVVAQNLLEINPHTFVSVPRVYEKVLAKVHESVAASSPLKQKIFAWAEEIAAQALPYRLRREWPPGLLGVQLKVADALVFSKLRSRFGTRFRYAVSGGAPLAADLAKFFWGAGLEIYEGYGLSETSPVLTVNAPFMVKMGTVGTVVEGTELKIAEDGEILARGPQIMRGYYNLPDATAEAIDGDGWFHTGDIGEIDADGYLKITDRKKEIIVNAYGKNVAPAPIENALKASRFIEQAVVIGDQRKFLAALLVPNFEALKSWAAQKGLSEEDPPALLDMPDVRQLFASEVETVNNKLARYERVRTWELLPTEFTIETGELTPTQKVKRRVIDKKYIDVIDQMYEGAKGQPTEWK
ncbi:MAG: long-chain fatty acid--CoA ligase [Acidobacteriota bacterium]